MIISNVYIQDVDMSDYPDFSDAFIEEAFNETKGRWCTEKELEKLEEEGYCNDYILNNLDLYNFGHEGNKII